jgi:flagellar protein FlgJ
MSANAVPSIFDMSSLAGLKGAARKDDPKALKAAAQQFEAMFMQMVLKSMRDATPREGMLDSEQTRMYEQLLDQQLGQVLASRGSLGLSNMIEKQLGRRDGDTQEFADGLPLNPVQMPLPRQPESRAYPLDKTPPTPLTLPPVMPAQPAVLPSAADAPSGDTARDFVARILPHADAASRATGVPAQYLVAHAALETGWGRAEPRHADGRPTFNLFGIKAGRNWNGATAEAMTTEYVDGVPQRQVERFRAYGSYSEAFRDYAGLLVSNPRYAGALDAQDPATFARGLQRGGYATDPAYADKLTRIIGGATLRSAMSS